MTIVAIGNPETLKQAQRTERRLSNPSMKLVEDMRAALKDETLATWEHLAAEMQKIGYVRVWPVAFELLGKNCPKGFTALKQKVVAGAVAKCLEKFVEKYYFDVDRLDRTMKRIGAIYLLAKKAGREGFVSFSFGPVLAKHGIPVPGWLELKLEPTAPKHEEHRRVVNHDRPRRSATEMWKNAPARVRIVVRANGTTYVPPTKHKAIVPMTDADRAARDKKLLAAKAEKEQKKRASAEKANKKAKGGNKGGKRK